MLEILQDGVGRDESGFRRGHSAFVCRALMDTKIEWWVYSGREWAVVRWAMPASKRLSSHPFPPVSYLSSSVTLSFL